MQRIPDASSFEERIGIRITIESPENILTIDTDFDSYGFSGRIKINKNLSTQIY